MASKVDGSYSAADASYRRADNLEKRIAPFEEQLSTLSQSIQLMSQNFLENTQNNTNFLSGLAGLESKLKDIEEIQETFGNKLIVLTIDEKGISYRKNRKYEFDLEWNEIGMECNAIGMDLKWNGI